MAAPPWTRRGGLTRGPRGAFLHYSFHRFSIIYYQTSGEGVPQAAAIFDENGTPLCPQRQSPAEGATSIDLVAGRGLKPEDPVPKQ
jgi:hypothetical protein